MGTKRKSKTSIQQLSVIVPSNPFVPEQFQKRRHCLCALDVVKLMEWWPGTPHSPHRNSEKVKAIQRALDWKRVVDIAAFLLQKEISGAPALVNKFFKKVYEPRKNEPGREWPPKLRQVVGFQRSEFPTFSNILLHVNGARIDDIRVEKNEAGAAKLIFDEEDKALNVSVIDGQHRINGAFLAVMILREGNPSATWEIPAEVFLDLDAAGEPPRRQAQIFIDVNYNQKKVDRSLVADLYPTARGLRDSISRKERAQDLGRRLMLETGPLVGMIQIPGIRYGVKNVITLATLNSAIEDILEKLEKCSITNLDSQTAFIAEGLTAWLKASGRFEGMRAVNEGELTPQNVAYQGRILVSVIALVPAMLWKLKTSKIAPLSGKSLPTLTSWLRDVITRANLLDGGVFIGKDRFKERGFLGSGGIGRFRSTLWACVLGRFRITSRTKPDRIATIADKNRTTVLSELGI